MTWTIGTVPGRAGVEHRNGEAPRIGRTEVVPAGRRVPVAVAALLLIGGCDSGPPSADRLEDTAPTVSAPAVRTDREPLAKRFPRLGDFSEAHWQGSTAGTDTGRVPGPTDVRIVALVELTAEDRKATVDGYRWEPAPAGWEQSVSTQLRPFLPSGGAWQTNKQYADDVLTPRYGGKVHLHGESGTVFLDAVGG